MNMTSLHRSFNTTNISFLSRKKNLKVLIDPEAKDLCQRFLKGELSAYDFTKKVSSLYFNKANEATADLELLVTITERYTSFPETDTYYITAASQLTQEIQAHCDKWYPSEN